MCVKLSVIIPVYNAEKYLNKCLDSLICQSMKEMEIISVNDGSIDNSLHILKEYEEKDRRVIIVNQKNGGPANARKAGYNVSKGKYIALVDADDWVEQDVYCSVIQRMELVDADIGVFNWYINDEFRQTSCLSIDKELTIEERNTIVKLSLSALCGRENPIIFGRAEAVPWNKVYKRELLEQLAGQGKLFIDNMRYYDDGYFIIRVFHMAKKLLLMSQYGYHVRRDNVESITTKYYNTLPPKEDFDSYMIIGKEYNLGELYDEVVNSLIVNLFWRCIDRAHYFHKKNEKKFTEQIMEINHLIKGECTEDCFFPIKEAMEKCNIKWIDNGAMRFLVKHNRVSALNLYLASRICTLKRKLFKRKTV